MRLRRDRLTASVPLRKYNITREFERAVNKKKTIGIQFLRILKKPHDRRNQPHRAVSMGMICFFRDMTLGRNTSLSRTSVLKAWRMVSSSPR